MNQRLWQWVKPCWCWSLQYPNDEKIGCVLPHITEGCGGCDGHCSIIAKRLDVFFFVQLMSTGIFPDTWHVHILLSRKSRFTSFTSGYPWLDEDTFFFLFFHISHQIFAVCSQKPWAGRSHKLEESLRTHFTTQTIWHLVMLCQYVGAQDGCCYYFVISTFRGETSEISLPCARMSTNDRTVGKEQQICYRLTESCDGLERRWASTAQLAARRSFRSHHQHSWCTT